MYDKPISYSGKSLYDKCPLKWHSSYILGIKEPAHPKAERGVVLHGQLEDYFNDKTVYPAATKALAPWREYMAEQKRLMLLHGGAAEGEIACDQNWKPMAFDDPSAYARGKKDLHYAIDDVLHIKDWKSGKIYEDHPKQGQFYAAISPDYDLVIPEFVYLDIPLHTDGREYTRSQVEEIREELADQIAAMRHDTTWAANPGDHCTWCKKNWRNGGDCTKAP